MAVNTRRGDLLLTANLAALCVVFVPTLLQPDAKVNPVTALVYTGSLTIGAFGYWMNRQIPPLIGMVVSVGMWAIMFFKSWPS